MEMQLTTVDADIAVLHPVGRLDMLVEDDFRGRVRALVAEGRVRITVDFARVVFLDSRGVAALLHTRKVVHAAGGELRLLRLNEQARLVLRLTNLDRVFPVLDDYAAAA
jgi:anti-sigma B factor antagonist